jgi:hypothetical protein
MSQTLNISTHHQHDVCDICARTLLRGEQTETFIGGGRRYNVCELCKPHALHEGWLREGAIPEFQGIPERERRRPLLTRLRGKAGRDTGSRQPSAPRHLDDELSLGDWTRHLPPVDEPLAPTRSGSQPSRRSESSRGSEPPRGSGSSPSPSRGSGAPRAPAPARATQGADFQREPRHVHAIPSSIDHKVAAAVDSFNATDHPRTISGVARSLGAPSVTVYPDPSHPSTIWIVAAWELCWYRYEVDLSEAAGNVRLDGQGYELSELQDHERVGNAGADDAGAVYLF